MRRNQGRVDPPSLESGATGRGPRDQRPRSPNEALEPARVTVPQRRHRRQRSEAPQFVKSTVRFLNGALTVALMLALLAGGGIYWLKYQFDRPGPLDHATVVVIPPGNGVNAIAQRLEREGVISDARLFVGASRYFQVNDKLKAGEYEIKKSASMRQVLDTLVEGKAILLKVSVPEGRTSFQIVEVLNAQPELSGEITEIPTEGTLLPDTYKFSRGADRNELIARMQQDMKKYLAKQWLTRAADLPYKTPEEAIIMASIVEKETGRADERDRIAGVFKNRLEKGMRLQTDPTIIYYLTGGKGKLGRGIRRSELDAKHPYNSYLIDGLPPTPICNPGRAAIEAVLNPATTKDLYFVADGSGGHAFAESIRDHQKNVAGWRKIEKAARAKLLAEAAAAGIEPAADDGSEQSAGTGVALELDGVSVEDTSSAESASAEPQLLTAGSMIDLPLPTRRPKN